MTASPLTASARIPVPPASTPITDSTGGTLDAPERSFFDRPFGPDGVDRLAGALAAWLRSPPLRWLVDNVPGRRTPDGPVEPLGWPWRLDAPDPAGDGGARLAETVAALAEVCDWARPGTAWDFRVASERPLQPPSAGTALDVTAAAVAERATALGLCSQGRLETVPRTLVVLGGRRLAPLNRVRAAAAAIRDGALGETPVILLSAHRVLDRDERHSPEVRSYAPGARTETDLMLAAARQALGADPCDAAGGSARATVVEVSAPPAASRASTYDTLCHAAANPALGLAGGPVALVTSPTCRPFQYVEAVRALGLERRIAFELIAHPRAWAAAPGSRFAAPHVYLQEIRSAIQAAARLAAALDGDAGAPPAAPAAALA
jgi:hypothetical protein